MVLLDQLQSTRAVLGLVRHEALVQLQLFGQRGAQGVVVIHDQDLLVVGHGGSSSHHAAGTGLAARAVSSRMTSIKSSSGQVGVPPSPIWRAIACTTGECASPMLKMMPK